MIVKAMIKGKIESFLIPEKYEDNYNELLNAFNKTVADPISYTTLLSFARSNYFSLQLIK